MEEMCVSHIMREGSLWEGGADLHEFSVTESLLFLCRMSVCVGGGGGWGVWVCIEVGRGHRGEGDVEVLRVE